MTEERTIKENQVLMLEYIGEVREDICEIKKQFKEMNGSVRDTIIKLAVTDSIARQAQKRADEAHLQSIENPKENRRYIDRLVIIAITSMVTAIGAIITVIVEMVLRA